MNRVYILGLFILFSCGTRGKKEASVKEQNQEIKKEASKSNFRKVESKKIDKLLSFFSFFNQSEITIEVKQEDQNIVFSESECIPLKHLPAFNNIVRQTSSITTGAKPIGKIQLDSLLFFLVFVQQDDYGPIYYGVRYNLESDQILSKEIIGQTWGDAGDLQITKSKLTIFSDSLIINKNIRTCHFDLEAKDEEMVETTEDCNDSTVIINIEKLNL